MTEYTEQAVVVDALRYCVGISNPCERCPGYAEPLHCRNGNWMAVRAADMIEAQYRQIEELRQEITKKDKEIVDLTLEIMSYPDEEVERKERCGL